MTPAPEPLPEVPTLLDPGHVARVEAVHRDLVMYRFPYEVGLGLQMAYLRTYASPRVAGLLVATGHVQHAPLRRATDTALFMYELFHHGLDSDVGRQVVHRLNQMHHRWSIRNEDYLWILGTFAVLPAQMIDRYAWRKLTDVERQASTDWYRELGTRMGITGIPANYEDFEDAFRDYEVRHLRRNEAGQQLLKASWDTAVKLLPKAVRPFARPAAAILTDEPARSALGFSNPDPVTAAAIKGALLGRGITKGRMRSESPQFQPGGIHDAYPQGYRIEDLGVTGHAVHPQAQAGKGGQHPTGR